MNKNNHNHKHYCAMHLNILHLDAYLYDGETIAYEIYVQKKLLFSGTSFQPLLNTPLFSLPTFIALLQYVMVPVDLAQLTDEQVKWVLSPAYKLLESRLQQYNGEKKWEKYFQSAIMHYKKEHNIRLYYVVYKTCKRGNEQYNQTILLTDQQKQALLEFLGKDEGETTRQKIQAAIEDNFNKSIPHQLMKLLRIKRTTIEFEPSDDKAAAQELATIRQQLIKNY